MWNFLQHGNPCQVNTTFEPHMINDMVAKQLDGESIKDVHVDYDNTMIIAEKT